MTAVLATVRSELTKAVTLRSTWLVVGAILVLNAVVIAIQLPLYLDAMAGVTPDGLVEVFPPVQQSVASLAAECATWPLQIGLLVFVVGAHLAGSDLGRDRLGVAVLAVPDRARLVGAKALATALVALVVGLLLLAPAVAATYAVVRDWDPALAWGAPALTGYARFLVFVVTTTLVGFALALLGRRTLSGVLPCVVMLGLTLSQAVAAVAPGLDALLPTSAARNLLVLPDPTLPPLTSGTGYATAVLVGWAVVAVAASAWSLHRQDAR